MPNDNSDLPKLLARAALDAEFREALAENAERTARIAGLQLTEDEVAALNEIRFDEWGNLSAREIQERIGLVAAGVRVERVIITRD